MDAQELIKKLHYINEVATFFFAIFLFLSGYVLGLCHKAGLTKESEKDKHPIISIIKRGKKKV